MFSFQLSVTNGSTLCICGNCSSLNYQSQYTVQYIHFAVLILCLYIQENAFCITTFQKNTGVNYFKKRTTFLIRNKAWGVLSNMEQVKKKNLSSHCNTSQSCEYPRAALSFSVIIWCNYLITYQCYFVPLEVCTGVLGEFRQNYSADFW